MGTLILFLMFLFGVPEIVVFAVEPDAKTQCLYLSQDDGGKYTLGYTGHACVREGYEVMPSDRYEIVANWSFNAATAGIISPLEAFRIRARLATLDEASKHGRYGIHNGFRSWSEYKWAQHVTLAYLMLIDTLG